MRITKPSQSLSRWMRLGIATITSTALVGGALAVAPSHPLLSANQVASAQEIPANADAYAFAEQLNLSAPGVKNLLTTEDPRGVDGILQLLEAEQVWDGGEDDDQAADISDIELELLGALNIRVSATTIPLIGDNGLLRGELGALRAYAHAPADSEAHAAVGLITDTGALDLSGTGASGNASLDLTSVLGLDEVTANLLDEASLNLGALSSTASKTDGVISSDYQIAEAEVVINSPLVGDAMGGVQDLVGELDGTLNGLLGQQSVLSEVFALVNGLGALIGTGLGVSVEVPLQDIMDELAEEPLKDENGLVSIDLSDGQIRVDLAQLHGGDLNNLPADTSLLTSAQLGQITDTVTSLLSDGAAQNPNGLNARLQDVLMGNQATERGGLYGTEVQIELDLLGSLAGLDLRTTLGGLLNEDADRAASETAYNADKYNTYYQETHGVGNLLGGLLNLIRPILGAVGTLVEGLIFGDGTRNGLLSELFGNVQEGVIVPLLASLDPLLEDVIEPLAEVTVNRQETTDGLFKISALELDVLNGMLVLPIATSAVSALGGSTTPTSPTTPGESEEPTSPTTPGESEEPTSPTTPGESEEPTSPTTPGESEEPTSPTTPGESEEPTSPTTPGESEEPTSPTTPGESEEPTGEPTPPTTPAGSTDGSSNNDGTADGSSEFLEKCLSSPASGIAGLLAVLGTAAAIGGPAIDPLMKVIGTELDRQLRTLTAATAGDQPTWVQGINKGLNEAANAVDSRMVSSALFATAVLALVSAPVLCGAEGSSTSSS